MEHACLEDRHSGVWNQKETFRYVFNIMGEEVCYVSDELTNELDWKYNLEILPTGEFSMVHNLAKIYKTLEKRKTF